MKWFPQHIIGGQLVAAQTTGGGFKDVLILTVVDGKCAKVSLLDGMYTSIGTSEEMAAWLNKHSFVPISKTVTKDHSATQPPENRLGLPQVQIISLRNLLPP